MKELKKNEKIFIFTILGIYIVVAIIKVLFHEPWRDEAQAWLLARDLNIIELINNMKYEGHPILWHMLLKILQLFRLPYVSQMILHAILNITAVYLILTKIDCNKFWKFLFIFSDIVAFEYLVISRNYVLVLLLLVIIAIFYKDRFNKPVVYSCLLVLLANTTAHILGLVGALAVLFAFESIVKYRKRETLDKRKLIIIITSVIVVLVSAMLVIVLSYNFKQESDAITISIPKKFSQIMVLIIGCIYTYVYGFTLLTTLSPLLLSIIGGIILLSAIMLFYKQSAIMFIYIIATGFLGIFMSMMNSIASRHMYIYVLIFAFCFWLRPYYIIQKSKKIINCQRVSICVLYFCMILLVIVNIKSSYSDLTKVFSDSRNTANFIKENKYEDYIFVTYYSSLAAPILPYFEDKSLWSIEDQKEHTYMPWTKEFMTKEVYESSKIENIVDSNFNSKSNLLLILNNNEVISDEYKEKLELIYETNEEIFTNEKYSIYKYK